MQGCNSQRSARKLKNGRDKKLSLFLAENSTFLDLPTLKKTHDLQDEERKKQTKIKETYKKEIMKTVKLKNLKKGNWIKSFGMDLKITNVEIENDTITIVIKTLCTTQLMEAEIRYTGHKNSTLIIQ